MSRKRNRKRNKRIRKRDGTHYITWFGGILLTVILIVGLVHMAFEGAAPKAQVKKHKAQSEGKTKAAEKEAGKTKEKEGERRIRVVLKTNGFQDILHPEVTLSCEGGLTLSYAEKTESVKAGESVTIQPTDERFQSGSIRVSPSDQEGKIQVQSLERGIGVPAYRGMLELFAKPEGIAVINELLLEEYLYGVVPSEMPASYEKEALKAQAVCARSYAYSHCEQMGYPEYEAHVDDSTAYQVYGNSGEQERTNQAVDETKEEVLRFQEQLVKAYYFSTSCGKTTDVQAWGTTPGETNKYLSGIWVGEGDGDYEEALPWYRWTAKISREALTRLWTSYTKEDIGTIQKLEVTKRGTNNVALEVTATGEKGTSVVKTEYKIRKALGGEGYEIDRNDGTTAKSRELLPSAFFSVEQKEEMFYLKGGGYGHGIGMSQNGADKMAETGKTYKEILSFFYQGVEISRE